MEPDHKFQLKSFGECMIEIALDSSGHESKSIGGDTFNACAMASLLGISVEYSTRVASDDNQDFLVKEMASFPLELNLIEDSSFNGKYFITTDSEGERFFSYERAGSSASKLSIKDLGLNYLANTDAFFNSGITMALSESLSDCVREIYLRAKERSVLSFFDINYREKLWDLERAASSIEKVTELVDVLFVSEEDIALLRLIFKGELNQFRIPVIERLGKEGCVVHARGKSTIVSGLKALPVDTTGAGDIFTGSFINKYLKTKDLVESAHFANQLAAKHTEFRGGTPKEGLLL